MPHELWDRVAEQVTLHGLLVNAPYVVAFVAVAAELAWRTWRAPGERRPFLLAAATATAMGAGAFVVGLAYTAGMRFSWETLGPFRWEAATSLWADHPVVGALVTFVAWDLAGWVYHLLGHRTAIGWAAHQAHHSGPGYDLTIGLRQSWTPVAGLVVHPFLALAGFDLRVVFVCAAISNCWQVLEHTAAPVRLPGWLEAVVMTPAAHRHHHARTGDLVNIGPFLTVWDRLAGTWVPTSAPAPVAYGPATPASANPLRVEAAGWAALLRRPAGRAPASRARPAVREGVGLPRQLAHEVAGGGS